MSKTELVALGHPHTRGRHSGGGTSHDVPVLVRNKQSSGHPLGRVSFSTDARKRFRQRRKLANVSLSILRVAGRAHRQILGLVMQRNEPTLARDTEKAACM